MNILIDNFKADLDRLIDNSITITSNKRKDLVNRITEEVFSYDDRYTTPKIKGGKEIKKTKVTFLRLDKGE